LFQLGDVGIDGDHHARLAAQRIAYDSQNGQAGAAGGRQQKRRERERVHAAAAAPQ